MTEKTGESPEPLSAELEREKINIERKRLDLDWARLEAEKRRFKVTILSVLIPVVLAIFSFGMNAWWNKESARNALQLKTAELVSSTKGPYELKGRIELIEHLLGDSDLVTDFNVEDWQDLILDDDQWEFLNLLMKYPKRRKEIGRIWLSVWDKDTWVTTMLNAGAEPTQNKKQTANKVKLGDDGAALGNLPISEAEK